MYWYLHREQKLEVYLNKKGWDYLCSYLEIIFYTYLSFIHNIYITYTFV